MKRIISVLLIALLFLSACGNKKTDKKVQNEVSFRDGIISIAVDGAKISDFSQDKYEYTHYLAAESFKLPNVTVEASGVEATDVVLTQATDETKKATVKCKDEVYTISFEYEKNTAKLNNTYNLLNNKKQLNVAFLGGSITQGVGATTDNNCYAALVTKNLNKQFPEAKVNYKNIAWSGTGSVFGAYRLKDEAAKGLGSFIPDLVFVEFAINDVYDATIPSDAQKYMETIVNEIYGINKNADVVFVFTTDAYKRNQEFEIRTKHKELADKYNIPCIYVGEMLVEELINNRELFTSYTDSQVLNSPAWKKHFTDSVHPSDLGHKKYAEYINTVLERIFSGKDKVSDIKASYKPEKTVTTLLKNPSLANAKGKKVSGFTVTSEGYLQTEKEGATFTVTFTGTSLKIWAWAYVNGGILSYSVDGGMEMDMYLQRESNNHKAFVIANNLENKEHTVTFKVKKAPNATSKIDVRYFMIEGNSADKKFSIK